MAYDAYVSTDGKADYLLPSAAFADGKTRIFLQPGTYYETTNVVVPENGSMTGANRGSTVIDFSSNNASVTINSGFGSVQTAGTVSVARGSVTVTGDGTSFSGSNLFVFLAGRAFAATVVSATELTLARPYNGLALSGVTYKALALISNCQISNITIRNSGTNGLFLAGCRQTTISNVVVEGCTASNVLLNNCTDTSFHETSADFGAASGFQVITSTCCQFRFCSALSNANYGLLSDAASNCLSLVSVNCTANDTNFRVFGDNNTLTACVGSHANTNSLDLDGNTTKVTACSFTDSGVDNIHVFSTAYYMLLAAINFNRAGNTELNNESPTTQYSVTCP